MANGTIKPLDELAEAFRSALSYSQQHRNSIDRFLRKAMPDAWPQESTAAEEPFYRSLAKCVADPETRKELRICLMKLSSQKGNRWKNRLPLENQLLTTACRFQRSLPEWNGPALRHALDASSTEGPDSLLPWLDHVSDAGRPAFRLVWRILTAEGDAEEYEDVSTATGPDLEAAWKEGWDELSTLAAHTREEQPAATSVSAAKRILEQLTEVAAAHEEAKEDECRNVISAALDNARDALLERADKTGTAALIESVEHLTRHVSNADWSCAVESPSDWGASLKRAVGAYCAARAAEEEARAALKEAMESGGSDLGRLGERVDGEQAAAREAEASVAGLLDRIRDMPEATTESPGDDGVQDDERETFEPEVTEISSNESEAEPAPNHDGKAPPLAEPDGAEGALGGASPNSEGETAAEPPIPTSSVDETTADTGMIKQNDEPLATVTGQRPGAPRDAPPRPAPVVVPDSEPADPHPTPTEGEGAKRPERPTPEWLADVSDWSVQKTSVELRNALAKPSEDRPPGNALLWSLVRDGRLGLAYQLATSMEAESAGHQSFPPSALLEACVLALYFQEPTGPNAERLRDLLLTSLGWNQTGKLNPHLLSLYRFTASLRPALMAPDTTSAYEVLKDVTFPDSLSALTQLREAVGEFRAFGVASNPAFFRSAHEYDAWRRQLAAFQDRAGEWWERTRHIQLRYGPATDIWRDWLDPTQPLGQLMTLLVATEPAKEDVVRGIQSDWQRAGTVSREVHQTDRRLRGRRANLRPIEGRARNELVARVQEPLGLADEWLDLVQIRPEKLRAGYGAFAEQMRDRIQELVPSCLAQLESFSADCPDSLATTAAVGLARAAVEGFRTALLEGMSTSALSPGHRLRGDLLLLEDSPLGESWELLRQPTVDDLLVLVDSPPDPAHLQQALVAAGQRCRHDVTKLILECVRLDADMELAVDDLEDERSKSLRRCRDQLEARCDDLRNTIERAFGEGLLAETERLALLDRVGAAGTPTRLDIAAGFDDLEQLRTEVDSRCEERIANLRTELDDSNLAVSRPNDAERIAALLEHGDILTASEYLTLAEAGTDLPEETRERYALEDFFPQRATAIADFVAKEGYSNVLLQKLQRGEHVGPFDFSGFEDGRTRAAVSLLKTWQKFKSVRTEPALLEQAVTTLLQDFGLQVRQVRLSERTAVQWASADCQVVADKDLCALPRYGSACQGHYRLLLIWQERPPGEVLGLCAAGSSDQPLIVLYGGTLSNSRRREFGELCRERRQSVLVVDETLVYFLAMEQGARLPVLLQCATPFTIDNPYTIASSNVPVEMFFGRRQEMASVLDPLGTNLVYGGRQLGKTALLREVERRNHDPATGTHVYWVDLKPAGIGLNRPATDLWQVIASALAPDGIVERRVSRQDTLANQIMEWLDGEPRRRILLLLDEADAFLALDRGEHRSGTLDMLKALMDRTNRRFKVVLAGLHNVQRTARDPNMSLAQLGKPLCIGPLVTGGEIREAIRLVTHPFATLGFRFSPEAASRILSYTNYYPSLIQIFCWHLLEHLSDWAQGMLRRGNGPPFEVTVEQIEEAYLRKDLRSAIAERFRFTLDLDGRYKLIALRIALEALEKRAEGESLVEGCSVEWLRDEALALWPAGFEDRSFAGFRVLLDEMVGLGLLRHAGQEPGRYALRSLNVIALLGTQVEIEEALLDATEQEPALVYDASTYRRTVEVDKCRLSPLTGYQEAMILGDAMEDSRRHGVGAVLGLRLAGLDQVDTALVALAEQLPDIDVRMLPEVSDLPQLERALEEATQSEVSGRVVVWIVPSTAPWTEDWLESIARIVNKLRVKRTGHRVLFQGDGAAAWRWLSAQKAVRQALENLGVFTCFLAPWTDDTLRRWLGDAGFGPVGDTQDRNRLANVTGGWGEILHALYDDIRGREAAWRERLEALERDTERFPELDSAVPSSVRPVLELLVDHGDPIPIEEIAAYLDREDDQEIRVAINWADAMGLLEARGRGSWSLRPPMHEYLAARGD